MYGTRWCTKEDVLEDLGRASGRRPSDVDDGCLFRGERPPPPKICNNEDDEMELYFGLKKSSDAATAAAAQQPAPDLHGITKMIRMVQNYGDNAADSSKRDLTATSSNDLIVISKLNNPHASNKSTTPNLSSNLNPNVEEFVPRATAGAINEGANSFECQTSEPAQLRMRLADEADTNHSDIKDSDKQQQNERDKLAAVLRNEIQREPEEGSEGEDFHFRRKKYAAIAHLFKLHSTPAPHAQPVKLYTPDFYQNCKATESETKAETAHNKMTSPKHMERSQRYKNVNSDNKKSTLTPQMEATFNLGAKDSPKSNREQRSETDKGATRVPLLELDIEDSVAEAVDEQEVRASIHKVTRWLNAESPAQPAPAPRAALYLGPVTYKRKERGAGAAGAAGAGARAASADVTYVPSQYAYELGHQYAEREKAIERSHLSIWDKLEEDLKRKDVEIRKRNESDERVDVLL